MNTVEVEGNLTFGESVEMGIDPRATALIIRHLTNLYSNPHLAALREYTSNAFDSHKVAGTTRPVEVNLPDALNPNLVIEDFGVGLSREGLRQYGQYGLSSKNESNDEIGGFGLGSKSGLAIASQFTVTAVKDGLMNMAIVAFGENGAPSLNFLNAEPTPTDKPNGVKITIPTTDGSKYIRAIEQENFFLGWEPGSVTVDEHNVGASVYDVATFTPIPGHGWIKTKLRENYSQSDGDEGTALVGPVKYRINWREAYPELDFELRKGYLSDVVVDLPIGSVDLTPSREDLIYSKMTRETIRQHVDAIRDHGKTIFQDRINQAADFREAVKLSDRARARGFKSDYTYNGETLTAKPDALPGHEVSIVTIQESYAYKSQRTTYTRNWGYSTLSTPKEIVDAAIKNERLILITDATATKQVYRKKNWRTEPFTQHSVSLALQYFWQSGLEDGTFDKNQRHFTKFYMTSRSAKDLDPVLLKSFVTVVKASDVETVAEDFKKVVAKARRDALKGTPRVAKTLENTEVRFIKTNQYGGMSIAEGTLGDLDTTKSYIHLPNHSWKDRQTFTPEQKLESDIRRILTSTVGRDDNRRLAALVDEVAKAGDVIFLLSNKTWATENYAKALTLTTFPKVVKKMADKARKGLTQMEILAAQDRDNRDANWAGMIHTGQLDKIERKETRVWIQAMNQKMDSKLEFISKVAALAAVLGLDASKYKIAPAKGDSPASRYPLLKSLWSLSREGNEAAIEYINMMDTKLAAEAKAAKKAEKKAKKTYEKEFASLVEQEQEVAA